MSRPIPTPTYIAMRRVVRRGAAIASTVEPLPVVSDADAQAHLAAMVEEALAAPADELHHLAVAERRMLGSLLGTRPVDRTVEATIIQGRGPHPVTAAADQAGAVLGRAPFVVAFRNAISSTGLERRGFATLAEAEAAVRDHRPWNNTSAKVSERNAAGELVTVSDWT